MKKMKGIVPKESPSYVVYEDQRAMFRHQSLLQDYEELQKETEGIRMKLQHMKQKKSVLSAEVRFLRKRYNYLLEHPLPKPQPKQDISRSQKLKIQAPAPIPKPKGRNHNRKESTLRPLIPPHSKSKERTVNGIDTTLQKSAHLFDLNQNAWGFSGKDASFQSSAPVFDFHSKERAKEATKKSTMPFFDLNQISTEEEELQGNESLRMEEPKRSIPRSLVDEQQNEIKLSVCRNAGDGSNRTGKRKISWQDQVALRV